MRACTFIGIVLLGIVAPATGQVVTLIETNKTVYEYGEPIELKFTITNNTSEGFTIWSSSGCQAWFQFDDVTPFTICTADDVPHYFPPNGSYKTWIWSIDPSAVGLPETDGVHHLVAYYGDYRDSLTIEAPKFLGGRLMIEYPPSAPADSIASLRSRFDATVVDTFSTNPMMVLWEIQGTALYDAIAALEASPYLTSVDAYRRIDYASIVANESDVTLPARISISSPYPNPFSDRTAFDIATREAGPMRAVLYDLLGRDRGMLFDGYLPAGATQLVTIEAGELPAGVYLYRVEAAGGRFASTVVLAR